MRKPADFLIAGGGPAGATAAALLASRGERVVVVERSSAPQHKVCGEFLSCETLAYMQHLGLNPWRLGAVPIRRVRLAADDLIAEASLPFEAASLSRKTMDTALLQHARACGADIITGRSVERLERDESGWRMLLDDARELRGNQAMIATGKHDLRGRSRGDGMQAGLVALKVHVKLATEQARQLIDAVEIVLLPGGYLGIQRTEDGNANFCLLIRDVVLRKISGGWPGVLRHMEESSRFVRARLSGAQPCMERPLAVARIPYGFVRRETVPGLWHLGDQAAVIPSFSGDGMAIALHSAHCAVEAHAAGRGASEYTKQMHRCHRSQVTWATMLSRLIVERPKLAQLIRFYPSLLRRLATSTRISEQKLIATLLQPRSVL